MPQLNKGGKFVFGLSVIRPDLTIHIPPQALSEYDAVRDGKVIIFTGSKITGGFCVTTYSLLSNSKLYNYRRISFAVYIRTILSRIQRKDNGNECVGKSAKPCSTYLQFVACLAWKFFNIHGHCIFCKNKNRVSCFIRFNITFDWYFCCWGRIDLWLFQRE